MSEYNITQNVIDHEIGCAYALEAERLGKVLKCHLKVDSGMGRLGFREDVPIDRAAELLTLPSLNFEGVFTHLANAEEVNATREQVNAWNEILAQIDKTNLLLHIQNTAGTFAYDVDSNMVRVGISLYGLYPDLPIDTKRPKLKQILSLKARITNIHELRAGEGVSYGHTYTAYESTKVATIPIGYADGVSRLLSNKIEAEVNGEKIRQIGNITMDQMMFDLGDTDAQVGDVITLLNEYDLTLDSWARLLGTINYELTCRLKVRLPRVYTR